MNKAQDKSSDFCPWVGGSLPKTFSGLLSHWDAPCGSSIILNKGSIFTFSILPGQCLWPSFSAGSYSGRQKPIEIDESLTFQCSKNGVFINFQAPGWSQSAEPRSWKTQVCMRCAQVTICFKEFSASGDHRRPGRSKSSSNTQLGPLEVFIFSTTTPRAKP